jgi:hypothetical protein
MYTRTDILSVSVMHARTQQTASYLGLHLYYFTYIFLYDSCALDPEKAYQLRQHADDSYRYTACTLREGRAETVNLISARGTRTEGLAFFKASLVLQPLLTISVLSYCYHWWHASSNLTSIDICIGVQKFQYVTFQFFTLFKKSRE